MGNPHTVDLVRDDQETLVWDPYVVGTTRRTSFVDTETDTRERSGSPYELDVLPGGSRQEFLTIHRQLPVYLSSRRIRKSC